MEPYTGTLDADALAAEVSTGEASLELGTGAEVAAGVVNVWKVVEEKEKAPVAEAVGMVSEQDVDVVRATEVARAL